MKYLHIALSIFLPVLADTARSDDLPKRVEFSRYATMLARSPFAVATAPVQAPTTPNWSKDLYVANLARTAEADYVTVISGSDKNLHEYLSTIEPNAHGYSIANIQLSEQQGETKVTISKDGQYATLGFNQALMTSSSPPTAPAPPPTAMPNANPNPNPAVGPKPFPTPAQIATPQPHVRGVIERNPRVQPQQPVPPAPNPEQ